MKKVETQKQAAMKSLNVSVSKINENEEHLDLIKWNMEVGTTSNGLIDNIDYLDKPSQKDLQEVHMVETTPL
jgi:hypothetical protein